MPEGVSLQDVTTERLWIYILFGMGGFAFIFVPLNFIIHVGPAAWLCGTLTLATPVYLLIFKSGYRGLSKLIAHLHVILVLFFITLLYTEEGNAWTFMLPIAMGALMIFTAKQRVFSFIIIIVSFLFLPTYILIKQFIPPMEFSEISMNTFKILNLSGAMSFSLIIILTNTYLNRSLQKQLRLQLEENSIQNKIMLGSIRTRDKLLSMMSHDVRGDIGKTIGVVDVIEQMSMSKEDQASLLHNLKNDARKTLETLDNMLQWTRTQNDELNVSPEVYAVDRLLSKLLSTNEFSLNTKRINIQVNVPVNLKVLADINMIDCVFRNLLGNAIKFTPVGGRISIGAMESEDSVDFLIQDSGVGMTQEQSEDIKKGVQFTTRGTNREKGRGFGMVLINEFLAKHKSELIVKSTPGKGSTFSFSLPKPTNS